MIAMANATMPTPTAIPTTAPPESPLDEEVVLGESGVNVVVYLFRFSNMEGVTKVTDINPTPLKPLTSLASNFRYRTVL